MEAAVAAKVPVAVQRVGSMLTPFFLSAAQAAAMRAACGATGVAAVGPALKNYADVLQCDTAAYGKFFRAMLDRGVMLPPSQFEAWFVSTAHTEGDIDQTVDAAKEAFGVVRA